MDAAEAVDIANGKFYQALSLADPAAMHGLWLKSELATCQHPGWQTVTGYEDIQKSWAVIFLNQGPAHIWPSQVSIVVDGGAARVNCIENIDATNTSASKIVCVRAANEFRLTPAGWKLLHHAAEAAPGLEAKSTNQRLTEN